MTRSSLWEKCGWMGFIFSSGYISNAELIRALFLGLSEFFSQLKRRERFFQ